MIRTGFVILAGTMLAAYAAAQTQNNPPANPQTPQATAPAPTATNNAAIPNGPAVTVELNGSVDSKKAKVGDKVEARTLEPLKNGNDVLVPKGTKLIGHVTQATARSKGDSDSSLAIQFDKAESKKEQEVPLTVMILAVAPPTQANVTGGGPSGADPLAGTATGQQTSPMGGGRQANPNAGTGVSPTGGAADSGGGSTGPGTLPANSRGVYGMKDLKLMMNRAENKAPSTVITSAGKDVRLDSGTRLLLVSSAGPAPAASGQ